MHPRNTLKTIQAGNLGVRFTDMCRLVEAFGFRRLRVSGSHHIFGRPGTAELVNLQAVGGRAKPYQVRQFIQLVERYSLKMEDDR